MSCCGDGSCAGAQRFFTRRSRSYGKRQRKKGLEKVQQQLVEGIERSPITSAKVLDIGCGVGAVHLTLLEKGADRAVGIDAAPGMIKEARRLAMERGLLERVDHVVGDFVSRAGEIRPADITILDKVVCCYEHLDTLVALSTDRSRRVYAITRPRDRFIVRSMFKIQIGLLKLFRATFRPFWHDWDRLHRMIREKGFRPMYENNTFLWTVAVFERVGPFPA